MIGPTCLECQTIHTARSVVPAGSRFNPDTGKGYQPRSGGRVRLTREQVQRDICAETRANGEDGGAQ